MTDRSSTGGYDPSGIDLDAWTKLEEQLEQSIPHYDRVNRWMTFGQDKVWRKNVRNHAKKGMKILEVGCGPGSFAEDLVGLDVTCLDPSAEMLRVAKKRVDSARKSRGEEPAKYVEAIAESIPLPDDTFDRVFCLFSFRDFQDKKKGLEEIFRVLKPGGQLVICDAGKANWFHGLAGRIWMATIVQLIARVITKEKDHPWKGLARTYSHYGTNGYYRKIMREVGFDDVQGRLLLPFGMSSRFRAFKPKRGSEA
ncbi:MAG: class I SAM-dependent methyltransferase [Euryarchaeota archaeon]|jgi:demethylmenaquinone methyltransferase/2-methoxy-6-polyprenyl-1,4-benzoquinol methylase|nr:class I SAM-dependent methyltransferase [Euryarchaeota archaeon]MBT5736509.1 class I SAM-dependent methyltransferase [Euryarchaeota archaeon]